MASLTTTAFRRLTVLSSRVSVRWSPTTTTAAAASSSSLWDLNTSSLRSYVSRAHPQEKPVFPVNEALEDVLKGIQQRNRRRLRKWKRNNVPKTTTTTTTTTTTSASATENEATNSRADSDAAAIAAGAPQLDETVELAINLNLDPRKPGQSLRGSVHLPAGTGKKFTCIVFTNDPDLQEAALQAGAAHAGGMGLMDELLSGDIPVDSLDRSLATADMMNPLSKKVARLLGPRGLMPNAKTGTLVQTPDELLAALATQVAGSEVQYRTERDGVVHVPVGKASFLSEKLLDNIGAVLREIYAVKPEQYGKGKKGTGKAAKYLLSCYLSSTQGPSIKLDPRTVDPNSPFFLKSVETGPAAAQEEMPQAA